MTETWKIKVTGQVQFLLIYFFCLVGGYFLFSNYATDRYGGSLEENLLMGFLIYSPVLLTALILPPIWIVRKKRLKKIELDSVSGTVSFDFSKGETEYKKLEDISFYIQEGDHYTALIIYYRTRATRGHWLYFKAFSILAPDLSISWTRSQLRDVAQKLKETKVLRQSATEEGTFWSFMFE